MVMVPGVGIATESVTAFLFLVRQNLLLLERIHPENADERMGIAMRQDRK